ncbi:MAG: ImmA/IrrE family metallo-endopeptidase [Deltaproteobacteria bacterium]|jgi:Zn-dependent peptidase ImmA (M78 family)|nr:ImmA/IrrE family metallo-endopeptidase [Deltaproteobacteria bacterium]
MAKLIRALINKETLVFICSQIGVTTSCLASKAGLAEDKLAPWLDVKVGDLPTINQAKKMAKALKIPFAALYLNKENIPVNRLPKLRDFRKIPFGIGGDDSGLNIAIADLIRSRDFLISTETELGLERAVLSLPPVSDSDAPADVAATIRTFFGIELAERDKRLSPRQFYLSLRGKVESKGIFVSCFSDVAIESARGLAICDGGVPIIGVNAMDGPPAKSFAIIHELVHVIKRRSALCNEMVSSFSARQEEAFCNEAAGEVLVPARALAAVMKAQPLTALTLDDFKKMAERFCVSGEVILRRLFEAGQLTKDEHGAYADEMRRDFESDKEAERLARQEGEGTPSPESPSREAVDNNSSAICRALLLGYGEGHFSKLDVAGLLGIKEKRVPAFMAEAARWSTAAKKQDSSTASGTSPRDDAKVRPSAAEL